MTAQETADATEAAAPKVSQRALTIGLCAIVVAIAFETIAVATAMPIAARDLEGLDYYAWAFSAFLIGMLFATVICGRVSDRIGPAKPLLVGLMIFAIYVCVAVAFSRRQRPKMFTYISTAWVLPSFVGPPVSAWLTQHLSWHWVFFAVIPLVIFGGAMAFPSLLRMMRTRQPSDADAVKPAPVWAAGLLAMAAAMLQLAGQRLDWLAVGLVIGGIA